MEPVKVIVLGESGVGKTCLLVKLTDNVFMTGHRATIGVDFKVKYLNLDDNNNYTPIQIV